MSDKKSIKIRPIIAIVCDDIRTENNGKPILIGIYTGGITLSGPVINNSDGVSNLSIFLWILCEVKEAGVASFEIKIIHPNPKHQFCMKAKIDIDSIPHPTELMPLALGPIPLNLWENGNLQILFKHEDEDEYQTLRNIPITLQIIE